MCARCSQGYPRLATSPCQQPCDADPTDESVMILLAHNMVELAQLARGQGLGVYQAITDFHALASAR